jgi:hypothetical protein
MLGLLLALFFEEGTSAGKVKSSGYNNARQLLLLLVYNQKF